MPSASSTLKTQMSRESLLGGALFIFFVLGLSLGLAGAPQTFNDGDVSWHVATGEWILRHQAVPATDPFSFTAGGQPWVAMEWSADVIYALAFCYYAWFTAVKIFPTHVSAIGSLLVPIVGVTSSSLFLGEPFGWREMAALILVVSAVALVLIQPPERAPANAATPIGAPARSE